MEASGRELCRPRGGRGPPTGFILTGQPRRAAPGSGHREPAGDPRPGPGPKGELWASSRRPGLATRGSPAPSRAEPGRAGPGRAVRGRRELDMGSTTAPEMRTLPLACLTLLLLHRSPGTGAQEFLDFKLHQPQGNVSVTAGETLTLTCTISGDGPVGPVKWLKGWGSENETFYEFPRVTRAAAGSSTDFTILIRDVRLEDAGTYYCVKYQKSVHGVSVFKRGEGTEVSVYAKPSRPVVSGPWNRAGPGQSVPFTCTAGGFFPREIAVKWLKDGAQISAQQPQVTPGRTKSSYDASSTVSVTLQEGDVRSQLQCEVHHRTLPAPLRSSFQLSRALRVPPSVQVVAEPPSPVEVNKTVNLTCLVKGFYPGDVAVAWLENGTEMSAESPPPPAETPRGLFELRSLVEVQATEEKNGSVFTCRVVHDAQGPVSGTSTLRIAAPAKGGLSDRSQTDNDMSLLSSPGLWLGILLEKGLLGGLLFFFFRHGRA
ncbi:signal-regulatory protein beta-1-like [Pezoporus wallicus]|uniref:signal-regulatory protein beta-1-like n=2 Tax=Pezoporus TaxID=35539 RepID=UPI0025518194|nr:signal-regulatory protein beta-1-like [Pezoporus wallicus]